MADRIEIKPNGEWVFHGEDSRLRDPEKNALVGQHIWNAITQQFEYQTLYKVYCKNCGADGGLSARTAVYVNYLCDKCFESNTDPDFSPMPPDEEVRWRNGLPAKS